jgi:hypothetical protein
MQWSVCVFALEDPITDILYNVFDWIPFVCIQWKALPLEERQKWVDIAMKESAEKREKEGEKEPVEKEAAEKGGTQRNDCKSPLSPALFRFF